MITRFQVKNYKALRDVTLDLTPIHVLIGPNDSGKTSILEAIAALCRSVDHDLPEAFVGAWSGLELIWRNAKSNRVRFDVSLVDEGKHIDYMLMTTFFDKARTVKIEEESITVDGHVTTSANREAISAPCHLHKASSIRARHIQEAEIAARPVYYALVGALYYRFDPRMLALPVALDAQRKFQMDASGFGLALVLDNILGDDRKRFMDLEKRFQDFFPDIESIKLKPEMAYRAPVDVANQITVLSGADGKGLHFRFTGSDQDVPASQVSDGMLLVLAYMAILYLPKPPRVLLIEEPENGIHPRRLQEVLKILRDLVEGQSHTQVILTTHSPYAVDEFSPEEVTVCFKQEDGSVAVKRMSESQTVIDQKDIFTLGEIWAAEGDESLVKSETVRKETAG